MLEADGLNTLIADLTAASITTAAAARQVVQKGAYNVKTEAQQLSSGLSHAPLYPQSITYETGFRDHAWEAVIGPDKDRPQGALGNILEYGTSKNPPYAHLGPALDREGPRFEKAVADLVDDQW